MSYSFISGPTGAISADGNSVASPAFSSLLLDIIFVEVATFNVLNTAPTGNGGDTFLPLTGIANSGGGGQASQLFYKQNPTKSASYVVNYSHAGSFPSISLACFSGSASNPLDQQNVSTLHQPGSITPTQNNEVIICGGSAGASYTGLALDSGFTIADQQPFTGGKALDSAIAYLIQTNLAAVNPTWSVVSGTNITANGIGSFFVGTPIAPKSLSSRYREGNRSNWNR